MKAPPSIRYSVFATPLPLSVAVSVSVGVRTKPLTTGASAAPVTGGRPSTTTSSSCGLEMLPLMSMAIQRTVVGVVMTIGAEAGRRKPSGAHTGDAKVGGEPSRV